MIKKIIIILFTVIMFWGYKAQANDNYMPVRVGISDTNFRTYMFNSAGFNNPGSIEVMDSSSGYSLIFNNSSSLINVVLESELFSIYEDGKLRVKGLTGPILVKSKDGSSISISGLKRKGKQALYRGYIELIQSEKDKSKFAVVNVLSLKNYLRGVVPNEMPVRFGLEALKAQTVAARNYAVTPRIKAYKEFDLCDSVACQVYFGSNTEDKLSDEAIEETNSIIAVDKEYNPILALYSSTAGGYTESYKYAFSDPKTKSFPSEDIPYLSAVSDNKHIKPLDTDEKAEKFYTSSPESFDKESPYYRWSKEWKAEEIEKVLSKTLVTQSKTGFVSPVLESEEDFGHIESIKVLKRGESGKIIKLEIKTDKNTFVVEKELVIRRCFQKNGISLPSANFVITKIDSEEPVYKVSGGGFGHGVGLSQWGAGKMSALGYSFDEILQHYYKGIKLSSIPTRVRNNNNPVEQSFKTFDKKTKLVIKNPDKLKRLKVVINDKEFIADLKNEEVIDISKYVKKDNNKIIYMITDEKKDGSKFIIVSVVLKEAANE